MLKKFFISMLGTMAGLWLSLIVFVFVGIMAVGVLVGKSIGSKDISGSKVLLIDLKGDIPERDGDFNINNLMDLMNEQSDCLEAILSSIRLAADDKDVKMMLIKCGGSSLGVASRSEIIQQINYFKNSGKAVYAYGDELTQGDYYVATAADCLYLNPVGSLDVRGLSSTTMFFKDVLSKLGVTVNVVRVGSYKSAVEPFLRMDMSPESREQTQVFLNQIWGSVTETIADNMHLSDPAKVNNWADSLCFTWDPERYVEAGAIHDLAYFSDVEAAMRDEMDLDEDTEIPYITPSEYLSAKLKDIVAPTKKHVAVLYAVGDIVTDGDGGIASETMVPEIQKLAADKNVAGLVLRVNSPGGSAFASEQIWHALEEFKSTGKPFFVSMGDYAASGGYYISCGANKIFSDPATLTGSIGIFGVIPNAEELLTKRIGLGFGTVETNKYATFPSYYSNPSPEALQGMQQYVERGYDTFTSRVAQGRNIPQDSVKAIGGGRVWDGISALKIGLVDQLGTLSDAIGALTSQLGLEASDYYNYPEKETNILHTLLDASKKNIEVSVEGLDVDAVRQYIDQIKNIQNIDPIQARMDYTVIR